MKYKVGDKLLNKYNNFIFKVIRNDIPYHKGFRYECRIDSVPVYGGFTDYTLLEQDLDRMILLTPENEESIKLLYANKKYTN